MTRTQIQLPDQLHARAKAFAAERELSLAEITRRGLELLLDRYPRQATVAWHLPAVDCGGLRVPLRKLREAAHDDETTRSMTRP